MLLAASGAALAGALERAARRSPARAGVALVYHGVGDPPGDLEHELLPVHGSRLFAEQVHYLSTRYRLLPASRLVDARQTLGRLSASLGDLLDAMGEGLQQPWSTEQTESSASSRTG